MFKDLKEIITQSTEDTYALGKKIAQEIKGGEIICLTGELGAGKTTFSQGFLRELGVRGALTSPTFVVMKQYALKNKSSILDNIYHIDTYRVESNDIMDLGWEEITNNKKNITLVEWPEKIKDIIPAKAIWIRFEVVDKNKRKIKFIG